MARTTTTRPWLLHNAIRRICKTSNRTNGRMKYQLSVVPFQQKRMRYHRLQTITRKVKRVIAEKHELIAFKWHYWHPHFVFAFLNRLSRVSCWCHASMLAMNWNQESCILIKKHDNSNSRKSSVYIGVFALYVVSGCIGRSREENRIKPQQFHRSIRWESYLLWPEASRTSSITFVLPRPSAFTHTCLKHNFLLLLPY